LYYGADSVFGKVNTTTVKGILCATGGILDAILIG